MFKKLKQTEKFKRVDLTAQREKFIRRIRIRNTIQALAVFIAIAFVFLVWFYLTH